MKAPNKVARKKVGRSENNDNNEIKGLHKSANGDDGYCHCCVTGVTGVSPVKVQKNSQANRLEDGNYHLTSSTHLNRCDNGSHLNDGHLNGSHLNSDHRPEVIEEGKGSVFVKDDPISESNEARRIVGLKEMASYYGNSNGPKGSLTDSVGVQLAPVII